MPVTPMPGVTQDHLLSVLYEVLNDITARPHYKLAYDLFNNYLVWSADAVRRLTPVVQPADVERLVLSQRHWALQTLDPANRADTLATFTNLEFDDRARELESAIRAQQAVIARWAHRTAPIVVPDTNVLAHHPKPIDEVDWRAMVGAEDTVHLVLPLLVIDQLDDLKKSSKQVVRTRARTTLRTIEGWLTDPTVSHKLTDDRERIRSPLVTVELFFDDPGHVRLPDTDDELVDRAAAIQEVSGRPVVVAAYDHGVRLRARNLRLLAVKPADDEVE